jgi:hypothetical protein
MKHSALLTALLTTAVLTAAPASAQNMLAGTWEISTENGPGGTLTLMVDGMTLTGTLTITGGGRRGGGGGGGGRGPQTMQISDGTIEGSAFTFTVTPNFGGNDFSLMYSGTYEGDTIEGTLEGPRGGGRPFRGTRTE